MSAEALEQLLAERDIERNMLRYIRGVDRCDAALIRSAFHDDARDHHGSFSGGPDEYVAYVLEQAMPQFERTMHYVTNLLIDVDGPTAHCEAYLLAIHLRHDEPRDAIEIFGGRYFDRCERRDGHWRIAERWVVHEWDHAQPASIIPAWQNTFIRGSRGELDATYRNCS